MSIPAIRTCLRSRTNAQLHKSRFTDPAVLQALGGDACYACHPGIVTKCLRDIHSASGMTCTSCHVSMEAVASLNRRPWIDEPSCGTCHPLAKNPTHADYQFEEPGKLFRNSKGHMGIPCEVCHNTPHALTPGHHEYRKYSVRQPHGPHRRDRQVPPLPYRDAYRTLPASSERLNPKSSYRLTHHRIGFAIATNPCDCQTP